MYELLLDQENRTWRTQENRTGVLNIKVQNV